MIIKIPSITLTLTIIMALGLSVFGQELFPVGKCEIKDTKFGKPQKSPVITGKSYLVPDLQLRILDKQTNEPLTNNEVYFRYVWKWFDFLDVFDGRHGTWKGAYDVMICGTNDEGNIFIPAREIQPVGYNKGKRMFFWMKDDPYFSHVEVSIHLDGYISSYQYSKKTINKLQKEKPVVLHFKVSKKSPLE